MIELLIESLITIDTKSEKSVLTETDTYQSQAGQFENKHKYMPEDKLSKIEYL